MDRIINMRISNCSQCPFCKHNPDYGNSYDSGFDCTNENSEVDRIVDDFVCGQDRADGVPIEETFKIPNGCPLDTY